MACGGSENTPTPEQLPKDDGTGIFHGRVEFAPLCPVEPCGDDVYSSRSMVLQQTGGVSISVPLNDDGTFQSPVPVGTYSIHLADCTHVRCQELFPLSMPIEAGENPAFNIQLDMGDRTPAGGSPTALLLQLLQATGASAEAGAPIPQAMFSVPGQFLTVNGNKLQVFEYLSEEEAVEDTNTVASDGSFIGAVSMFWMTPPHFYHKGNIIALYIGEDEDLLRVFEDSLGPPFVEGIAVKPASGQPLPGHDPITQNVGRAVMDELTRRLGISRGGLELVNSERVEFSNSALGCPEPGMAYAEAIAPGYYLVYQYQDQRYSYHVAFDGDEKNIRVNDCRGENNEAVSFQTAEHLVKVRDAFQFSGGGPSNLGPEVIIRNLAEAQQFQADSGGNINIAIDLIDWDNQMLMGTVISGSGCGFDILTRGVVAHHLDKDVRAEVRAVQTGQCEKAWAVPMWLLLDGIPADYSGSFLLNMSSD